MVFQQRNGRIDRYGQKKRPDIRYMMIESDNKRIKGDMRIIEILIMKEEQALKNIGDPSLLLGKFTIEDEELVVIDAIEDGSDANAFEQMLDNSEDEFDPFEELMRGAEEAEEETMEQSKTVSDETLFTDIDYLAQALSYLNQSESHPVEKLSTVSGLDIKVTDDMRRRLRALVPEEALPQGETLRLSDDTKFVMDEMRRSMQNNMADTAWPKTQYLWQLHPLFTWVNDKAGLLFNRGEAPLVGLTGNIPVGEMIFVISGSIPNEKSTPLVDEWFGLVFRDGKYIEIIDMHEVIRRTGIRNGNISNVDAITEDDIVAAEGLRNEAVAHAREYLGEKYRNYQSRMEPLLDEEVDKLITLQDKHKQYYQLTLFEQKRKLEEKERSVDELFEEFIKWVTETLTIQDNPYIRIITVLTGVAS